MGETLLGKTELDELIKDYLAFIFLKTGIEPSENLGNVIEELEKRNYITANERSLFFDKQ